MPEGIGYNPGVKAKTNPTGRGGALGLLSEKLTQGIGNRRKKRRGMNQQQTLSQRSQPQKRTTLDSQADASRSQIQSSLDQSKMEQVTSATKNASTRTGRSGLMGKIANSLA